LPLWAKRVTQAGKKLPFWLKKNDKKPPDLTPVAFKGAWLIKSSQPLSVSLLEQSQDRLT
jgi:hypothetical protein